MNLLSVVCREFAIHLHRTGNLNVFDRLRCSSLLPKHSVCPITSDAVQPCGEGCRVCQSRQPPIGVKHRILQHILGGMSVLQQPPQEIPQPWTVPVDQLAKCLFITRLASQNEETISYGFCGIAHALCRYFRVKYPCIYGCARHTKGSKLSATLLARDCTLVLSQRYLH